MSEALLLENKTAAPIATPPDGVQFHVGQFTHFRSWIPPKPRVAESTGNSLMLFIQSKLDQRFFGLISKSATCQSDRFSQGSTEYSRDLATHTFYGSSQLPLQCYEVGIHGGTASDVEVRAQIVEPSV